MFKINISLVIEIVRWCDTYHIKTNVFSITLLMFSIDDITSMFAKISIENINTICVPQ